MSYNRFELPQKDLNINEPESYPKESLPPIPFIVGINWEPNTIDPVDSWDDSSNDVIMQVAETLFWYNLTNSSLPLEPLLAESYSWDVSDVELTINVRDNIYFHDGTKLNASAIKWNMDRILYFTNATGALPPTQPKAFPSSLYYNTDGATPIINRTEVISEMVVKIILNQPFGAFLSLLSYTSSSIISPTSHNATGYIDLKTGTLIGTGPFVYDEYEWETNPEINFHAFENYWNGKANITQLIFRILEDSTFRNDAMLNKDIHFLVGEDLDLLDTFKADPLITVEELGPDLIYWYLAFDCYSVNVTWREAISKAINYTYIIEEFRDGNAVRGAPAVPSGMPGHDPTVVVAQYDIPEARTVIQSMGFGVGWDIGTQVGDIFTSGANEADWLAATFFEDSNGHQIDMNYHAGSGFNRDLNDLIVYNLNFIGIVPTETTREWAVFLDDGEQGLLGGMWYVGWGPDYIDAFNMLDPLFNPASASNFINLTDPEIVGWLAAVAVETDIPTRYGIFSDIQHKLFEILYAHTSLHASLTRDVHIVYLMNYPYNSLGQLYFYPCVWDPPLPTITIITPSSHDLYGDNAPSFNILIDCLELDSSWYTIDNGITNITFTGSTGIIDQIEWDKKGNGTVTIIFYTNDTLGKIGYSEVVINKDITPPVITIIRPEVGDTFVTSPPIYSIDIDEANLDTIWYTLDNGTTNITISEFIGVIDEVEWNNQPNGYVTIRFYANDTLGEEGTALVIVTKNTPPEVPPGIPGANLLVIYLMLFIGIPILIWQRKKIIKY